LNFSHNKNNAAADPLVWIIIVNWNGKADTLACLASLRKISYPSRHILIVDNASADGSVEAIRAQFPEAEVLVNERNERFARANNQGMQKALAAGAEFVLLLNNDTEVAPDFLDHLVSAAGSRQEVGMVAPKIYYHHDPQLIWFAGGRINLWTGRVSHRGLRQRDLPPKYISPIAVDFLTGCAILAKRGFLEKVGFLNDGYFMYIEDVDWCWRAQQAGFVCLYQPAAKIWHKVGASTSGQFKVYHKVRSNFQFFKTYAKWYHWPTIVLGVLVGAVAEIIRQIIQHPRQAWRTVVGLVCGFWDILLRRKIAT
jgi:GT2 family glycosyltransferase